MINDDIAPNLNKIKIICRKIVQNIKNSKMEAVENEEGFLQFEFDDKLSLSTAELHELYFSSRSSSSMVRKLGVAALALTLKREPSYFSFLEEIKAVRRFKGLLILNNYNFASIPFLENYFNPFEPTKDVKQSNLFFSLKFNELNRRPSELNEDRILRLIDNNEIGWIPDPKKSVIWKYVLEKEETEASSKSITNFESQEIE